LTFTVKQQLIEINIKLISDSNFTTGNTVYFLVKCFVIFLHVSALKGFQFIILLTQN